MDEIERRYIPDLAVRADDGVDGNPMKISGYAALFDTPYDVGWFTETIKPGAFAESLDNGDDVRALYNHDPNLVLGRLAAGTLKLTEDDKGLRYQIDVPDTNVGRDLVVSVNRGDVSQSSFAFTVVEDLERTVDEKPVRELIRVKLWDVSPVTYPANADTTANVSPRWGIENWRKRRNGRTKRRLRRISIEIAQRM